VQAADFLSIYTQHPWIKQLVQKIQQNPSASFHWKGLTGSLPAVLGASFYHLAACPQLFILNDKAEASYFYTDLKNLLPGQEILFYPALKVDHNPPSKADMLSFCMRNAILEQLCQFSASPALLVSYPEAIGQPVVSPIVLQEASLVLQSKGEVALSELIKKLTQWEFEDVDLVTVPGQFALRGGIVDIFSYGYSFPIRLELAGRQIASIRLFDPLNQRSVQEMEKVALLPLLEPAKITAFESFLGYLPQHTLIWLQDYQMVIDAFTAHELGYSSSTSVQANFLPPVHLTHWQASIKKLTCLTFGHSAYDTAATVLAYPSKPPLDFHQQFNLLANDLQKNQQEGLHNFIFSASSNQLDRLDILLHQIDETIQFQDVTVGLSQGYLDFPLALACYTDHQIFGRHYRCQQPQPHTYQPGFSLREFNSLQPGDYVVHIDYGIARFGGLTQVSFQDREQEVVRLVYKDNDVLYVSLYALHKISKYTGKEGTIPTISKLGTGAWEQKKRKVKQHVQDVAKKLISLYSKRKQTPGFAFSKDSLLQAELEASFIYEDTPDQAATTAEVKKDMEAAYPMDRLVCGDVGFGKTEIAIRAAFKAVQDSKQVAVLVPTTILALQHYQSFQKRLAPFPVQVAYVNRFKTQQEVNQILQALAEGKVDILIGTHGILRKKFSFKDLGLLIIDEEQKFGVKAKEYMKELKINVDVLTLTATPIPRTLHFSLMGARDLSIMTTPPANRQPIHTTIHTFSERIIQEAIHAEVQRGGQVFFVHPHVATIAAIGVLIRKLVPSYRLAIAHGQLPGRELEKEILSFIAGDYDILLSTNIIESGLDVPNANTIIINESSIFGISDLHQMRGRVGRSNKKAFCYLIAPPSSYLTAEARKRLATLEEFSELGDGFKVAMRDLDIRGAGSLLGVEQSGFIADIGFEAYYKVLDDAVQELKETEFKTLFAEEEAARPHMARVDCSLETDLALSIPTTYVANDAERLQLYMRLDRLVDQAGLEAFQAELKDRFGPIPLLVQEIIEAVKLRWLAEELRFHKLKLKEQCMRCYMTALQTTTHAGWLGQVISYVQSHPHHCQLKQTKNALILEVAAINSIEKAYELLAAIRATPSSTG
jgi:transcription-repair coupling factor (superfamily II helicase)